MDFSLACSYRIRNKRSGLYLSVVDSSTLVSARLEQRRMKPVHDALRKSQVWVAFAVHGGRNMMVNMRSFLVMNVSGNSMELGAPVEQFSLQHNTPHATQMWLIREDTGYFIVRNAVSHLYLIVTNYSVDQNAAIQQLNLQRTGLRRDSQLWTFEVEDTFRPFPPAPFIALEHLSSSFVHEIDFLDFTYPDSKQFLIGQVVLPFLLINDEATLPTESPYYVLRRYSGWEFLGRHVYTSQSPVPPAWNTTLGLISGNAEQIKNIIGISVRANGSLMLNSWRFDLYGEEIANRLQIRVKREVSEPSCLDVIVKYKDIFASGFVLSVWFRKDRYVLQNMEGEEVVVWFTRSFGSPALKSFVMLPISD